MNAAHKTIKERDGSERGRNRAGGGGGLTAARTAKRLRGAFDASNLSVDQIFERLKHVVEKGVDRAGERVHDPGPVVHAPAARRTARAH
jgi:sugar/nucleoside kinase (ribokinase family)